MIFTLNFHEFLHTMYKYVLNSVVKSSLFQCFEYYAIILRGPFLWTRCTIQYHTTKEFCCPVMDMNERPPKHLDILDSHRQKFLAPPLLPVSYFIMASVVNFLSFGTCLK